MTLEQLEKRVLELERQLAELRKQVHAGRSYADIAGTFGMFANDDGFDEVVRLGREDRQQQTPANESC